MAEPSALACSVIVPCRGHGREVEGLLASLAAQTLSPERFEVLVVDDGSEPPLQLAPRAGLSLRVIRQQPGGPAAARNTAIRQARAPLFVFVNADALLAPDALERHLHAHASVGGARAVLGRFDFLPQHRTPFVALADHLGTLFPYQRLQPGVALPFWAFWTGNLSAPAEAVRAAGGFEERFGRAVFEDIELGLRLGKRGLPLVFDPSIRADHDHAFTLASWHRRAELLGHAWVLFARLHGGAAFPILDGQDEPDARLRADLLAGLLHQHDAHGERLAELARLLAEAEHALAAGTPRAAVEADVIARGAELLTAIHTVARMTGILAGLEGQTPEGLAAYRAALGSVAVVHSLVDPWDAGDTERILDVLPPGAELIVTHREWLAASALPDDVRLTRVRIDGAAGVDPFAPILAATRAEAFVFLEGRPLPSTSELAALVRFLGVSPAVGAIGLGERAGHPHAIAAVVQSARGPATATPRAVLAADRGPRGGLLDRVRARGLTLAMLVPAGAPAG